MKYLYIVFILFTLSCKTPYHLTKTLSNENFDIQVPEKCYHYKHLLELPFNNYSINCDSLKNLDNNINMLVIYKEESKKNIDLPLLYEKFKKEYKDIELKQNYVKTVVIDSIGGQNSYIVSRFYVKNNILYIVGINLQNNRKNIKKQLPMYEQIMNTFKIK